EGPEEARFCRACGQQLATGKGGELAAPKPASPEERARAHLEEAFRLSEAGRLQQAIQACQQAISFNPTSTSAHSLLGTLFERVGDREGAIREYEQVLTISPGSTVERRRLNELMGVPAAPEAAPVTVRTARLAVTGGFLAVALVFAAAIVLTTSRTPSRREAPPRRASQAARQEGASPSAAASAVAPPRLVSLGRSLPPRAPRLRQVAARPRAAPQRPGYGFGQWVGPGAYLLPSGGRSYSQAPAPAARWQAMGPFEGAVPMAGSEAPTLSTPGWRYPAGLGQVPAGGSTRLARTYYMQGDYRQAVETYRGYLQENPNAGGAVREELAWVYVESGDYRSARNEYRTALDAYGNDLDRGHNVEAARHGVRTCESALSALESH
ncbi:MAG: tetratricopeptide repeat protein, partial [Armatimonadota bacterium]